MTVHTKRSQLETAQWAGGTTTQLAIYPPAATYREFNFDFRISYATVEVEESTFTHMSGVTRHLMILEGTLEIDHEGRYAKRLNKFDSDVFSGEWPTKAKGRVTDFNLMTRGGTRGELEAVTLAEGDEREIPRNKGWNYTGIYLLKGSLQLRSEAGSEILEEGDFALVDHNESEVLSGKAFHNCEIIVARVAL